MVWIVVGSVLAVVGVLGWLYDRTWGTDPTPRHTQGRAQAESDQAWAAYQSGGAGGSTGF